MAYKSSSDVIGGVSPREIRDAIMDMIDSEQARVIINRWLGTKGVWIAQSPNDAFMVIYVDQSEERYGVTRKVLVGLPSYAEALRQALDLIPVPRVNLILGDGDDYEARWADV